MCIQTMSRTKSGRPEDTAEAPPSPTSVACKHPKTCHSILTKNKDVNKPKKMKKSVSFNEIVVIRPHYEDEGPIKKSVAFDEVVMVRPVLHLADYTNEEIVNSWYLLEDKKRMKKEIMRALKKSKQDEEELMSNMNASWSSMGSLTSINSADSDDEEYCLRGLERLQDGGKSRDRRRISIREVLKEQEAQRAAHKKVNKGEPCLYDASKFRKIYRSFSRDARNIAQTAGQEDREEIED